MTAQHPQPARSAPPRVALESTLLLHGVPRTQTLSLAAELAKIVRDHGARPVFMGVVNGQPIAGLTDDHLRMLAAEKSVPKVNTASLGAAYHRGTHGATTVSTTMELAAMAGIRLFATGGLGGVHKHLTQRLDISADLAAFTRFPVAVVTSGCKSLLDVISTREVLESLGVTVVGFKTDSFPAFYMRDGGVGVDARFDDVKDLARFVAHELARTCRGVVIANPIPAADELTRADWDRWLAQAEQKATAAGAAGRDVTPHILGALHEVSAGKTLAANLSLVRSNTALAAQIAAAMHG